MRKQKIKLKSGIEVVVDWDSKTTCKNCNAEIYWAETKNGKFMPIELVGLAEWDTHYATCKFANEFKKNRYNLIQK